VFPDVFLDLARVRRPEVLERLGIFDAVLALEFPVPRQDE
jgi:hypothetical protein